MDKFLGGSGFTIMMVGAAGMDSESMLIPIAIMVIGLLLLSIGTFMEEEKEQEKNRPS